MAKSKLLRRFNQLTGQGAPMPKVPVPQMPNKVFGNSGDFSEIGDYLHNQGQYEANKTKGKIKDPRNTIYLPAKKKPLPYKKYKGK